MGEMSVSSDSKWMKIFWSLGIGNTVYVCMSECIHILV